MQIFPVFLPYAGCPNRCHFCRQPGEELPAPEAVATALERMLPVRGTGEIAFYGGTFTLLPVKLQAAYLQVAENFLSAGRVSGVRISTRPDALPPEVVDRLKRSGVVTVELGCQSFSPTVLARSGRRQSPDAAAAAVTRLRAGGLQVGIQLMPGLPGGDREEAVSSVSAALRLRPDFIRLYPAVVFRGTRLETDWRAGRYRPLSLRKAVRICAELLWLCRRGGVPVIRTGLQESPELVSGRVAGPWHPAFGQLVRSRLWLRALARAGGETGGRAAAVAPADLGEAVGHRRQNLELLKRLFGFFSITAQAGVERDSLVLADRQFDLWQAASYEGTA